MESPLQFFAHAFGTLTPLLAGLGCAAWMGAAPAGPLAIAAASAALLQWLIVGSVLATAWCRPDALVRKAPGARRRRKRRPGARRPRGSGPRERDETRHAKCYHHAAEPSATVEDI